MKRFIPLIEAAVFLALVPGLPITLLVLVRMTS